MINRLLRGGSCFYGHRFLRTSFRFWNRPEFRNVNFGFRLVIRREP